MYSLLTPYSSPKETFQCHVCRKEFHRKDVYQRHLRAVHDPKHASQRKGWKKSCQRCIRYKLKCSRELPCGSCSRKHVSCTYDASVNKSTIQMQETPTQVWHGASPESLSVDENGEQNHPPPSADPVTNWRLEKEYEETSRGLPDQQNAAGLILSSNSHAGQDESALLYNDLDGQGINMMQDENPPDWHFQNPMAPLGQSPGHSPLDQATHQWLDGVSLDLEAFDNSMFRASRMDWLGCETDFSDQQTLPPMSGGEIQPLYGEGSPNGADNMARTMSIEQLAPAPQPNTSDGPQDKEDKTTWPGVLDRGGNELWPFDYASNKGYRKIRLPPLREILEQTVGHLPAIQTSTVKDLIRVLSAPVIPSLNDSPALEALPAVAFLGQLVKTYFAEFHPALPIIHVPTWRIEKCPSSLLAAMACIGATYSTADGSQAIAALLAEITQRTLFWMVGCVTLAACELLLIISSRAKLIADPSVTHHILPPRVCIKFMPLDRAIVDCMSWRTRQEVFS